MTAKKPAKKVLHVQSFCFANFLIPVVVVIALSLVVVLPRKTILDMRRLRLKTDDLMETRDEINVRRYPYKGSLLGDFRDNRMVFPFYLEHTSSKLSTLFPRETCCSKRIHVSRKNKKKSITVTFGHVVHVCRKLPAVKEVGWRADFGKHLIQLLSSRG